MNDGGPAFPRPTSEVEWKSGERECEYAQTGMFLRDYFAAAALQGMLAAEIKGEVWKPDECAARCYRFADAMLKERSKP